MRITLLLLFILAGVALAAGEPRSVAGLLSDLDSPNYQTRRKAVLAVEGRSEPELLQKLLAMAKDDPHVNIRSYCADVLGTFSDDRIYPLLVTMTKEKWPGPRSSAYVALGRLSKPEAYPVLVEGLSDESCRGYAAKGLGLLGDPRAWDHIVKVWFTNPKDGYLVNMAPEALVALSREKAIALFLERFAVQEFGRYVFVQAFREHPTEAIAAAMTGHLESEDDDIRYSAIRVLGKAGGPETVNTFLGLLSNNPGDRLPLASALAELGDRRAARPIAELLAKEKDAVSRVSLIGNLADLGDPRAIARLIPLLDDLDYTRQPERISSIWQFPYNLNVSSAALWAILTLADGEEPFDRNSLCSFPNPPSVDPHGRKEQRIRRWWKEHHEDPKYRFEQAR